MNGCRVEKNQQYILAQGDEITIGSGVKGEEVTFLLTLPGKFKPATSGIHAHYDLRSQVIGRGAFAHVKKAIERASGDEYAVKIIDKKKVMTGVAVEREIDILKKLKHEYIVGLRDFYEDANNYYLVMDLITGGDLMEFVTENGAIPEEPAREIARQVLLAVKYVHSLGISHRDIKPDNILIAQDEPVIVKVSDFGLAKISRSGSQLQTFCGTMAYLAPEIMARKQDNTISAVYSNKVDIWSIGCMLYVILTTYLPFINTTQAILCHNVTTGNFVMEPLLKYGVSKTGINFLRSLLTVDPRKRPSSEEALNHPWFNELTFNERGEPIEPKATPATNGRFPPVPKPVNTQKVQPTASKMLSLKRSSDSVIKSMNQLGIKNPEDFKKYEEEELRYKQKNNTPELSVPSNVANGNNDENGESNNKKAGNDNKDAEGDVDIPDADEVPDLDHSMESPLDVMMESPVPNKIRKTPIEEAIKPTPPATTSKVPPTQPIPNQNKDTSPNKKVIFSSSAAANRKKPPAIPEEKEDNECDSDKDSEEIKNIVREEALQRANRVNSSVMESYLKSNTNSSSSPLQFKPFNSVVRDMDPNFEQDMYPPGTWMTLRALETSIPHNGISISLPMFRIGRANTPDHPVEWVEDDDFRLSAIHCVIALEPCNAAGEPLGPKDEVGPDTMYKVWLGDWSRNGCYINKRPIGKGNKALLQNHDHIFFFKDFENKQCLGFEVTFLEPLHFWKPPSSDKNKNNKNNNNNRTPIIVPFPETYNEFKGWTKMPQALLSPLPNRMGINNEGKLTTTANGGGKKKITNNNNNNNNIKEPETPTSKRTFSRLKNEEELLNSSSKNKTTNTNGNINNNNIQQEQQEPPTKKVSIRK